MEGIPFMDKHAQERVEHICPSHLVALRKGRSSGAGRDAALEALFCPEVNRYSSAMAYNLSLIPWSVFGCVTFGARGLQGHSQARDRRKELFRRLLFQTARACGVRPKSVLTYGKTEFGDGDNAHIHFLVGLPERSPVTASEYCAQATSLWKAASLWRDEFGSKNELWQAKIEPFRADLARDGIAYVTKDERDAHGNLLVPEEFLSEKLQRAIRSCNARNAEELCLAC